MSKSLEAIISLRNRLVEKGIKDQFLEELVAIEKELKALEIIKFRNIDIVAIKVSHNLEEYKLLKNIPCEIPNDEEYELLKEVLL